MQKGRRDFIKKLAVLPLISGAGFAIGREIPLITNPETSLPLLGKIRIKTPKEFKNSPFGIGCETLDRDLWNPKEVYPWMDNLPVKWARLQTGWARVEKEKGHYDWKWLDESVDGLLKRGFKPFFNVGYGNPNYTEGDTGYYPLISNEAMAAWKKFITALAKRYKNKIQYYEIWNEPNLKGFWKPGEVSPEKYVKLVAETAPIIRKYCAGAKIIGGVVALLPFDFIEPLFDKGLASLIDIFSFHAYGHLPESYVDPVMKLRKIIDKYNPSIKIWQGECGYPSEPNSSGFTGRPPWTETIQAKIMLRRLITDCSLGIDMTLWFLIVDIHDYPKGSGMVNYKGILRVKPQIEPKKAFSALQNLGSILYGDHRKVDAAIYCTENGTMTADEAYQHFGTGEFKSMEGFYSTMLVTSAGKTVAYWETIKAADNCDEKNIGLLIRDNEGNGFNEPVLVDPISGNVYDLRNRFSKKNNPGNRKAGNGVMVFQKLPLRDYPLFICEKEFLQIRG